MSVTTRISKNIFHYKRKICVRAFKIHTTSNANREVNNNEGFLDDVLNSDSELQNIVEQYFYIGKANNCLIIQPYVKWGPQKLEISPEEQLEEAVSLVKTLKNWSVEGTLSVPLESLDKKTLFKSGNFDKVKNIVKTRESITAVFINISMLKKVQTKILQEELGVPILDRYRIVMQILKTYATTKHAKLQIAMAELHFMQKTMGEEYIFHTTDRESLKLLIQGREQKLKNAIRELRSQRTLLRNKRNRYQYPVIAVVGYTNSGKTSMIKALTGDNSLMPKNQLFATLDVTVHQGMLPSGLNVLYVDTVGFISEIPTNLIECFIATLEDAILADVILHVEDVSSSCFEYKRKHVIATLKNLANQTGCEDVMNKIIHVGNKCDIVSKCSDSDLLLVSAEKGIGLEKLRLSLEHEVIKNTNRKVVTIKLPSGGDEVRWLRKNATFVSEIPDEKDTQFVKAKIIITNANFEKFKHIFI